VRLGGIYALERIARDSPRDQSTIEEVLTAFVREHSPRPRRLHEQNPANGRADKPKRWLAERRKLSPDNGVAEVPGPRVMADVQASTTVLGRRQLRPEARRLDLRNVDLRSYELMHAHLEGANLGCALLEEASLWHAHLEGARLHDAHLERADLRHAHLEEASLGDAHLEGADLVQAHLEGADLKDAKLKGARHDSKTIWPEDFDWRTATGTEPRQPSESPPST
jgi:hypothetical protein